MEMNFVQADYLGNSNSNVNVGENFVSKMVCVVVEIDLDELVVSLNFFLV